MELDRVRGALAVLCDALEKETGLAHEFYSREGEWRCRPRIGTHVVVCRPTGENTIYYWCGKSLDQSWSKDPGKARVYKNAQAAGRARNNMKEGPHGDQKPPRMGFDDPWKARWRRDDERRAWERQFETMPIKDILGGGR